MPKVGNRAPRTHVLPLLVFLATAPLVAGGCGGDDDEQPATPQKLSVSVTEVGKNRSRLSVPASVRPGVITVELRNTGKRGHAAGLIRLDGNHRPAEVLRIIEEEGAPIPNWIHGAGGVQEVPPGRTGRATQRLVPGNYFVLDDAEGNRPAVAEFKVEGEEAGGDLPKASARIEAREYSFTATGLKPGRNTVEFVNVGGQLHHVIAARIKPGSTIQDVRAAFRQEEGEPPLDFSSAGASQVLDGGGASQVIELDLPKPGRYALLCFIQDRSGGPPHVAKGMITEATVR